MISLRTEQFKDFNEINRTGQMIFSNKKFSDNMSGSFILFRGAEMKDDWIDPYVSKIGKPQIKLAGNNSCSKNLLVALKFAFPKEPKKDHTATLFVITC